MLWRYSPLAQSPLTLSSHPSPRLTSKGRGCDVGMADSAGVKTPNMVAGTGNWKVTSTPSHQSNTEPPVKLKLWNATERNTLTSLLPDLLLLLFFFLMHQGQDGEHGVWREMSSTLGCALLTFSFVFSVKTLKILLRSLVFYQSHIPISICHFPGHLS